LPKAEATGPVTDALNKIKEAIKTGYISVIKAGFRTQKKG